MTTIVVDRSGPRSALVAGQHLADGGAVAWASELVRSAAATVSLRSRVTSTPAAGDAWPVELHVTSGPLVLVDIAIADDVHDWLDRLELRASRTWRTAHFNRPETEPRPWIGAVLIADEGGPGGAGVERLTDMVAARTIDAACVVSVNRAEDLVSSPNPALSMGAFQAALVGRCLYLATLARP